jgi:hypothetical protein
MPMGFYSLEKLTPLTSLISSYLLMLAGRPFPSVPLDRKPTWAMSRFWKKKIKRIE